MQDRVAHQLERFRQHLRATIRTQGFTQVELEERLGKSRGYLSRMLSEEKWLRLDLVFEILAIIGVEPREFLRAVFCEGASNGHNEVGPAGKPDEGRPATTIGRCLLLPTRRSCTLKFPGS